MADTIPRQTFNFSINVLDRGKLIVDLIDRINVDDVFLHLIHRELYRLVTGKDEGIEVNELFKDFLLKDRFTAGQ